MTSRLLILAFALALVAPPAAAQAPYSPAVQAALELPRSEPRHYVETAVALANLGEPDLATGVADELSALDLSDDARADLVATVGTARLVKLARLSDAAASFVEACMQASADRAASPARLDELVSQLGQPSTRRGAIAALRTTGEAGVEHCLRAIAASGDSDQQALLREALVALAPTSEPALIAALDADNEALRTQAAYGLGRLAELKLLETSHAVPLLAEAALLEPADSPLGGAARWAHRQAAGHEADARRATSTAGRAIADLLKGSPPRRPDADGLVALWRGAERAGSATVKEAGVVAAARLAKAVHRMSPDSTTAARRAMTLGLEAASILGTAPADESIGDSLDPNNLPVSQLNTALTESLGGGYFGAAAAVSQALGARGDERALHHAGGELSPLVEALRAKHPAARFAALEAILSIAPTSPYAGSSHTIRALLHFAEGDGDRVAIVATPNRQRSATIAGWLRGEGYDGEALIRGEDAQSVAAGPDAELVLLDMNLLRPNVRETLYRLRRTPATTHLPVGLLAADGRLFDAHDLADEHGGRAGRVLAYPRPHSADDAVSIAEALAELAPRGLATSDERREQAAWAREQLQKLLEEGPEFYTMRRHIDEVERVLSRNATDDPEALALVGTPQSQLRLAELASATGLPIELRRAAARAFGVSVERWGVLLTTDELTEQYDRYNASESADADTQAVLGTLLDTIESRHTPQQSATSE
ncbi:hypothetical protein Mal64_25660 [Pseudobythopirellula maris]|uniref:Response regulatory domain-containing protein n=1 Tax=Pseudobythopirellula maris TaxID=2527991 RepID=A0A5C5ZNI7_9BACT|nr:hypothetical protein [Pseudobythopirellula maris]TWT89074.1 hypothetical protein Mal64_25660 [Pseudobythopirellula maris]